jgi:hypothetical protein
MVPQHCLSPHRNLHCLKIKTLALMSTFIVTKMEREGKDEEKLFAKHLSMRIISRTIWIILET